VKNCCLFAVRNVVKNCHLPRLMSQNPFRTGTIGKICAGRAVTRPFRTGNRGSGTACHAKVKSATKPYKPQVISSDPPYMYVHHITFAQLQLLLSPGSCPAVGWMGTQLHTKGYTLLAEWEERRHFCDKVDAKARTTAATLTRQFAARSVGNAGVS